MTSKMVNTENRTGIMLTRKIAIAGFIVVVAGLCSGQKPNISNAKLQEISAAGGLKAAFDGIVRRQDTPAWVGYRVPAIRRERTMCCFDSWEGFQDSGNRCCKGCRLESSHASEFSGTVSDCSPPEPAPYSFVLFRVDGHQVMRLRNYSPDCSLDFGGLPLYWLEDVNPAQSVALLMDIALATANTETEHKRSIANSALAALALHDDPAADQAMEKLMQPDQPESIREHLTFWLGAERSKKGLELLRKYAREDGNERLREKITFALTVSKEPEAIKELVSMARNDASPRVRKQALFWMGQIGGRKEAELISEAIEKDPETEVKKRAVFALSQMKGGEGVPLLINLARTNKNPVVRKEAIRWLGMSGDPRALDFLEQILLK